MTGITICSWGEFRRWMILCGAMGLLLGAPVAVIAAKPLLNPDGYVMIDGAPRLVIGLYELPDSDATLRSLAENGFNLLRVPNREALDRIQTCGFYGWICIDPRLGEKDAAGRERLRKMVEPAKNHPALLAWELPDEAIWSVWLSDWNWLRWWQNNAVLAAIEKSRATHPKEEVDSWLATAERANDLMLRELFQASESLYNSLWQALGQPSPHPKANYSQCIAGMDALTEDMQRGCNLLREADPKHIIWQNHAPRNTLSRLRRYNRMVDAAGCDIYPAPSLRSNHGDLKDESLSAVGAYTDRMRAAAPGKAVWMVLQGCGWRDIDDNFRNAPDPDKGRRPTLEETRFMAYDALVCGANAIVYWGTHAIEKNSEMWADLLRVAREIRALEPALVAARPQRSPVALAHESSASTDPERGPRLILRQSGNDWVLIAVHEQNEGCAFTVQGLPRALEGRKLLRLYSDETHTVHDGRFQDGIRGFGVHVYATSRRFEAAAPVAAGK